ncbi:Cupredoxin [Vigna unguiculata]|uniref:Cupredoxin n=1 Tax=Vigna unguiculata TaxID=3917 RepID=A0A4D6M292_VIGUN|nr:Cupredoxin [Vigna unguiculata]
MGEGRNIVAVMIVLGMLLVLSDMVHARTFAVGKKDGSCSEDICWTFNVTDWPKGKTITSGDVLVFNYKPSEHNVVFVDKKGYETCTVPKDLRYSRVYRTGHDQIQLPTLGPIHFISSVKDDCKRGLKIQIRKTGVEDEIPN